MGHNPDAYDVCLSCGGPMQKGHVLCAKCSYIPIPPPPPLYPELRFYNKNVKCNCRKCVYEWLCRIWVFELDLWALCEVPNSNDLLAIHETWLDAAWLGDVWSGKMR